MGWLIGDGMHWPRKNIKWTARLGSSTFGSPLVANGLIWIWTFHGSVLEDGGELLCFRERDGKFLYKFVTPRSLENTSDRSGFASVPLAEGDRLWFITNHYDVVCLDTGPLLRREEAPRVVWRTKLREQCGVDRFDPPKALICCIGASYNGFLYVTTGDQQLEPDEPRKAPSLVCLDKTSGKVIWQDRSTGHNFSRGEWGSPLVAEINGRGQVIAPQGDGWLRSLDALTGELIWKFDGNPKDAKWNPNGTATRSAFVATPVLYHNRIYIGTGLAAAEYEGVGHLYCIDPTGSGDVSRELEVAKGAGKPNPNSRMVWHYGGTRVGAPQDGPVRKWPFTRTTCTCVVHDGLVYVADVSGYFHCLDCATGQHCWEHDLLEMPFGSACWVDNKIYQTTCNGDVWIFAHGRVKKNPQKIGMLTRMFATPVFANGVLYIACGSQLFAIASSQAK